MVYKNKIEKEKELTYRLLKLQQEVHSGSIFRGELECPDVYIVNELSNILDLVFDNDNYEPRSIKNEI